MSIDLSFFDEDMQQEAKSSKEISLAQLQDAFKYASQKEEMRKASERQKAELADKDDEIARLTEMLGLKQESVAEEPVKKSPHIEIMQWARDYAIRSDAFLELEKILKKNYTKK